MQPPLDSFFGEQPRCEHDRRIARIGAACDGRYQNTAVANLPR